MGNQSQTIINMTVYSSRQKEEVYYGKGII